jgi:hypothetical protein
MERHGLYYDLVNAQVFTDSVDGVVEGIFHIVICLILCKF